ncbi:MAG TPA: hypothetical protein VH583_20070 [Vicinamibacterales bacterium]|jgi:hypothetical protein
MDTPERFEQLIAYLESNLPEPAEWHQHADGTLQFISGDPPGVIVWLTETSVVVSHFAVVGDTRIGLESKPRRVGLLKWRRLPETALFNTLSALLKGAREARAALFQICEVCGRSTPPERLRMDTICDDCAEDELRIH